MNNSKVAIRGLVVFGVIIASLTVIFPGRTTVIFLIIGGYFVAPEAAAITQHYVFSNGQDLTLDADYIKYSPVVLKNLNLKPGEIRRIALKQHEDWRLSYALNPFHIRRYKDGYQIFQYVDYGHGPNKDVVSQLNFGFAKIPVKDNIVHSFECTPFTVYFNFKYSKSEKKTDSL